MKKIILFTVLFFTVLASSAFADMNTIMSCTNIKGYSIYGSEHVTDGFKNRKMAVVFDTEADEFDVLISTAEGQKYAVRDDGGKLFSLSDAETGIVTLIIIYQTVAGLTIETYDFDLPAQELRFVRVRTQSAAPGIVRNTAGSFVGRCVLAEN